MEESEKGSFTDYKSTKKKPVYATMCGITCFFLVLLSLTLGGCGRKKSGLGRLDMDSIGYTSVTTDIVTFISDSGVTKYKMVTDLWITREEPEELWVFPEGLYLEQFDTLFHQQASIVADTAYYHVAQKLWELKNNIHILNREGTQFFGNHLYWDEEQELVYSHDSVRIIRGPGEELRSRYGFRGNQYMTKYELYDSAGHMDVREEGEEGGGTTPSDSLATASPASPDSLAVAPPTSPDTAVVVPKRAEASSPLQPDSAALHESRESRRDSLRQRRDPGRTNPFRHGR